MSFARYAVAAAALFAAASAFAADTAPKAAKIALPPPLDAVCAYEIEAICRPADADRSNEDALYACLARAQRQLGQTCKAALAEMEKDRVRAKTIAARN